MCDRPQLWMEPELLAPFSQACQPHRTRFPRWGLPWGMGDLGGTGHPSHQAVARLCRHVPQEMHRVLGAAWGWGQGLEGTFFFTVVSRVCFWLVLCAAWPEGSSGLQSVWDDDLMGPLISRHKSCAGCRQRIKGSRCLGEMTVTVTAQRRAGGDKSHESGKAELETMSTPPGDTDMHAPQQFRVGTRHQPAAAVATLWGNGDRCMAF